MKKTLRLTTLLSLFLTFTMSTSLMAQELMYEVPMNLQVSSASEIIEGEVIAKQSFWDKNRQNIYTLNTVQVYKRFKGQLTSPTINIVTPGGTVGLESEVVTPSLSLEIGDVGVFMLQDNTTDIHGSDALRQLKPVASSQGFYKYNLKNNTVFNPFQTRAGISDVFYTELKNLTRTQTIVNISEFDVDQANQQSQLNRDSNGTIFISGLAPTTVNGGVRDLLVIDGGGFGTSGTVEFRDANFGGVDELSNPVYYAAKDSQIVSWADDQIVVEVPARAGTGDIRVSPDLGGEAISSQTLTVFYSQINPSDGITDFPTQHFDVNGSGGYTWQMHTDFDANTPAKESFLRAFDSWVCTTGINWEIGAVTTVDVIASDGINIIRFDNGTELPQGVLGRCTSRFGACGSGSPGGQDIVVTELDIVFNDVFTGDFSVLSWEFGPDTATGFEVDFESVAVHELGHGHQLAHIIDVGEVMHYSIANGQNSRDLGASDLAGATDVMNRNVNDQVCSVPLMTYSSCSTLGLTERELIENISIYPNPATTQINISSAPGLELELANIYDVRGRLVLSKALRPTSPTNSIDISMLHTGVYFIKMDVNGNTLSKKIIIE